MVLTGEGLLAHLRVPLVVVVAARHRAVLVLPHLDREQVLVRALLHLLALLHHDNPVAVLDGGEPVRHDHRDTLVLNQHLVQRLLHHLLAGGVEGRRRPAMVMPGLARWTERQIEKVSLFYVMFV